MSLLKPQSLPMRYLGLLSSIFISCLLMSLLCIVDEIGSFNISNISTNLHIKSIGWLKISSATPSLVWYRWNEWQHVGFLAFNHIFFLLIKKWSYIDIVQSKSINFITPQMKNKQQQQTKDPDTCWRRLRFSLYLCDARLDGNQTGSFLVQAHKLIEAETK